MVQTYDFNPDGDVAIKYSKGGNAQVVTLTYLNDASHLASLSLDRDYYPPGANVHMIITSLSHNIDPTDEDSWTYDTSNGNAYYQVFDESGELTTIGLDTPRTQVENFNFVDEALLMIDPSPNDNSADATSVLLFRDNADQATDDNNDGTISIN